MSAAPFEAEASSTRVVVEQSVDEASASPKATPREVAKGSVDEASASPNATQFVSIPLAPAAAIWNALSTVLDPEVPVISIVELGIVRDVKLVDGCVRIVLTPTYSGCPATELIAMLVRESMAAIGVDDVELVTQLAPAWTTDWIAPEAKPRLAAFGIAPPHLRAAQIDVTGISPLRLAQHAVPCPRCASARTRLVSQFGSTACKAQYRCDACLEPFDYFKPH
ncbi:MAG: 1,2-phenylacetyl-CoA epoxidase subunit PaaD [Betaproteobacteria bacterium]